MNKKKDYSQKPNQSNNQYNQHNQYPNSNDSLYKQSNIKSPIKNNTKTYMEESLGDSKFQFKSGFGNSRTKANRNFFN